MTLYDQSFAVPDLEAAIDRYPLVVQPDISLTKAIALMGQAKGTRCALVEDHQAGLFFHDKNRSGCVLVMEDSKILGILTERDIVKLTAAELVFSEVTVAEVMSKPVVTLLKSNFQDIFAALFLFRRYHIRHLPIVDEAERLIGVISPETIRHVIRPANLLKLRRVSDVMSKNIIHAPLDAKVLNIAKMMAEHRVSCVIITEGHEAENILIPVGIITERDILQFKFMEARLDNLSVQQVMSTPLFLFSPEDSLLAVHQEMERRRVRRLVVSWNWGQGLGIVTQTSMLRIFDPMEMYSVIKTLQSTVEKLEQEKAKLLSLVTKRN